MTLGLVGCSDTKEEQQKEVFHTVTYYTQNKQIRDKRIEECNVLTSMTNTIEKDCKNAKKSKYNEKPIGYDGW